MNSNELKDKTIEDLDSLKIDLLKEQFNYRMQKGTNQLSKPHLLRVVRRDIARINTIITQKKGA